MEPVTNEQKLEAIGHFPFEGKLMSAEAYGSGHINDTFLLVYQIGVMGQIRVILQRMNKDVFTDPVSLMENITGVTSYLRERIEENGPGDAERDPCGGRKALLQGFQRRLLESIQIYHGCYQL